MFVSALVGGLGALFVFRIFFLGENKLAHNNRPLLELPRPHIGLGQLLIGGIKKGAYCKMLHHRKTLHCVFIFFVALFVFRQSGKK